MMTILDDLDCFIFNSGINLNDYKGLNQNTELDKNYIYIKNKDCGNIN